MENVGDRAKNKPSEPSGGQQQRVAIAGDTGVTRNEEQDL